MQRRMKTIALFLAAAAVMATAQDEAPEFRFARIIGDGLVLQQEKPITIWGWAGEGDEVSVTLTQDEALGAADAEEDGGPTEDGERTVTVRYEESNAPVMETRTLKTKAGADGRWEVAFPAAQASFRETWVLAERGGQKLTVGNVLIGEVWICAGQSNMGWGNFNRKTRVAESSSFPGMRYVAWHDSWYKPLKDVRNSVRWQECSPETAQRFSAVPYLFGVFLHRYLKVPVGIINVARGGTTGDAWCLREELDGLQHVTVKETLRKYDAETATWDNPAEVQRIMAEWEQAKKDAAAAHAEKVAAAKAAGKKEPRLRLPKQPGDPRRGWSPPSGLFNATVYPIRRLGLRGVLYYQGENNVFMRWTRYEHTFPKIPVSFRKAFGDDALPFGCISQPGWGTFGTDPEVETVTGGYAIIRDIQRRALKDDANAGMIATYPTGNSYIHPGEKFPVAEYASLWALAKVYDQPLVHRGNEFQKLVIQEDKAHVYIDKQSLFGRANHAVVKTVLEHSCDALEDAGIVLGSQDRGWSALFEAPMQVSGRARPGFAV